MYKIAVDPIHALVRLQMNAMLGVPDTERLVADLIKTITEAKLDNYALIIDVSQCPVQSQDMIASMERLLKHMKRVRALAIVTGKTLVRLQVQRIFLQPYARFASTTDEALKWVLFGTEPAQPEFTTDTQPG